MAWVNSDLVDSSNVAHRGQLAGQDLKKVCNQSDMFNIQCFSNSNKYVKSILKKHNVHTIKIIIKCSDPAITQAYTTHQSLVYIQ